MIWPLKTVVAIFSTLQLIYFVNVLYYSQVDKKPLVIDKIKRKILV